MALDAKSRQAFARMFGGVAGAMDQSESRDLIRDNEGRWVAQRSNKYLNQVKEVMANMNVAKEESYPVNNNTNFMSQSSLENPIDISKYIGKKAEKQEVKKDQSQVELIREIINPINVQLEKLCVLVGLVYQALIEQSQIESETIPHETIVKGPGIPSLESSPLSLNNEIQTLERQLKNRPKPPTAEVIEADDDMNIDGVE